MPSNTGMSSSLRRGDVASVSGISILLRRRAAPAWSLTLAAAIRDPQGKTNKGTGMKYRKLGASDLDVSEISLGSWLTYGVGVEKESAIACVNRAFELG